MAKIAVLGCGFGTALAVMADSCGHQVTLWSLFPQELEEIRRILLDHIEEAIEE